MGAISETNIYNLTKAQGETKDRLDALVRARNSPPSGPMPVAGDNETNRLLGLLLERGSG
jgi:hypothetical protein